MGWGPGLTEPWAPPSISLLPDFRCKVTRKPMFLLLTVDKSKRSFSCFSWSFCPSNTLNNSYSAHIDSHEQADSIASRCQAAWLSFTHSTGEGSSFLDTRSSHLSMLTALWLESNKARRTKGPRVERVGSRNGQPYIYQIDSGISYLGCVLIFKIWFSKHHFSFLSWHILHIRCPRVGYRGQVNARTVCVLAECQHDGV